MFQVLAEYLFQYKKLDVPRVGIFTIDAQNAVNDFTAQTIHAPRWNILFTPLRTNDAADANDEHLVNWLAAKLNVSIQNASQKYEAFYSDIKSRLDNGKTVDWSGLGTLETVDRKISFAPFSATNPLFTGVAAKKVLRENASHNVLVGEKELTSEEMMELLDSEKSRGPVWKFIMWAIFFILLGAIVYYLFFRA